MKSGRALWLHRNQYFGKPKDERPLYRPLRDVECQHVPEADHLDFLATLEMWWHKVDVLFYLAAVCFAIAVIVLALKAYGVRL